MEEKEQLFSGSRSPDESDEYSPETVPEFEFDHSSSAESKGVKSIIEIPRKVMSRLQDKLVTIAR